MGKDYYAVLGVSRNADDAELKKASLIIVLRSYLFAFGHPPSLTLTLTSVYCFIPGLPFLVYSLSSFLDYNIEVLGLPQACSKMASRS